MYNLDNIEQTALAITNYVKQCMKEKKLGSTEIKEYERQARMYDFNYLLQISQEYIDMLNNMHNTDNCTLRYL